MIVRKLRLKKGWSQEQLAELTDLSVRTIQRAERGQKQSLETARSLAAIFEVDISTFNIGETTMNQIDKVNEKENQKATPHKEDLKGDEKQAIEYVKGIKEFYSHLFMYVIFGLVFFVFKSDAEVNFFWPFIGWGVGVIAHGLMAFEVINFNMHKWEKKTIEKKLGRKL
jgi:transcriptional regulator with XRE-family HTH domain